MISILLVDDHNAAREGLAIRLDLEHDLLVVGEASTPEEAIELAGALHPDIALIEACLGEASGIEAARSIGALVPAPKVVMLSDCADLHTRAYAWAVGVSDFVGKEEPVEALLTAIRRAMGRDIPSDR